jgi:hypothetical protein
MFSEVEQVLMGKAGSDDAGEVQIAAPMGVATYYLWLCSNGINKSGTLLLETRNHRLY